MGHSPVQKGPFRFPSSQKSLIRIERSKDDALVSFALALVLTLRRRLQSGNNGLEMILISSCGKRD